MPNEDWLKERAEDVEGAKGPEADEMQREVVYHMVDQSVAFNPRVAETV